MILKREFKMKKKSYYLLLLSFLFFSFCTTEISVTEVGGDFGEIRVEYKTGIATNVQIPLDNFSPQEVLSNFNQFKLSITPDLPPSTELEFSPIDNTLTLRIFKTLKAIAETEYKIVYSVDNTLYKGGFEGKVVLVGEKDKLQGELVYAKDRISGLIDLSEEVPLSFSKITEGSQNKADYIFSIVRKDNAAIENNIQISQLSGLIILTKGKKSNNGVYVITAKAKDSNTHIGSLTKEIEIELFDKPLVSTLLKSDGAGGNEADLKVGNSAEADGSGIVTLKFGEVADVLCNLNLDSTKTKNDDGYDTSTINSPASWSWSIKRKDNKAVRNDYIGIDNTGRVTVRKGADALNDNGVYIVTADAIGSVEYDGAVTVELTVDVKQVTGTFAFDRVITNVASDGTKTITTNSYGNSDKIDIFRGGTNTYAFLAKLNLDGITVGSKNVIDYV